MARVLHRTRKILIDSVNTPDYPPVDWIINPDLSVVSSIPRKYWKVVGDSVLEMDQAEKDAVDAAETVATNANARAEADAMAAKLSLVPANTMPVGTHAHSYEPPGSVSTHEGSSNPHPGYAASSHSHSYEALGSVASHEAAGDPHPGYLTPSEASIAYSVLGHTHSYEPSGSVATHAAASDPHPGYLTPTEGNAAYAVLSHSHDAGNVTTGTISTARLGAGTANSSTYLRGDQTWASPSGGSDPWTYVTLSVDFSTTSATAVDAGLSFTPSANTRYEFEAFLLTRTATTTVGPRPGIAWSTGLTDGVVDIRQTSSASAEVQQKGNISASVLAPVGGLPTTTGSWPAIVRGVLVAGASPSGATRVQLASETAGTVVTIKAGAFLRYRAY